jgi:hypothetical protein
MHVDLSFSYLRFAEAASFDKKELRRSCTGRVGKFCDVFPFKVIATGNCLSDFEDLLYELAAGVDQPECGDVGPPVLEVLHLHHVQILCIFTFKLNTQKWPLCLFSRGGTKGTPLFWIMKDYCPIAFFFCESRDQQYLPFKV